MRLSWRMTALVAMSFQGDRKGRPYYTRVWQADPLYSGGRSFVVPCSGQCSCVALFLSFANTVQGPASLQILRKDGEPCQVSH